MKIKIKSRVIEIKNALVKRYNRWREHNFIPSSQFIYWMAVILVAFDLANTIGWVITPKWLGDSIVVVVCILMGMLVKVVISWIVTLFLRNGTDELISAIAILAVSISGVSYAAFKLNHVRVVIIGAIIGSLLILFLKSFWSLVVGKRTTKFNISTVIIGSLLIGSGVWLFASKGFEDTYIKTYLQLEKDTPVLTDVQKVGFEKAITRGNYTVQTVTYDTADADMISQTVNLESYAKNKGMAGYIKEKYQGYGLDEVPIRGKVWYPEEVGNCPTLFIIHGNHTYTEESYLGYEYLGQYLASYGYVMVSVDENSCNLLTNENDARAILLLENIKALQAYSKDDESPIYQKIDDKHLAIAGHSRGGEAVSIAYLFNKEEVSPNNGEMKLDYHFNIESIIAIAPTIDQYKPTNKSVELEDVNYLIIHGANDQDLYEFGGMKQYKNIHFTGQGEYIKTSLYCAGCNHGQFNSRWGLYDLTGTIRRILNVKNFISEEEQQRIAEIFIKIFLDCTLKKDTTYIGLLEDYRLYTKCLPETLYVQSYQKSDFIPLCQFEEDTRLTTGTMEGTTLDVKGGDIWTEGLYPTEAERSNSALYLEWSNGKIPTLSISTPKLNMKDCTLQFDLMNLEEGFKEEEATLLQGKIIIEDIQGNTAEVMLSDYATIYPAFLVRLNKLQYLLDQVEYKHQFQTVSIPISAFKEVNEELDVTQLNTFKMIFTDATGMIAIDEIGYGV